MTKSDASFARVPPGVGVVARAAVADVSGRAQGHPGYRDIPDIWVEAYRAVQDGAGNSSPE